MIAKKNFVRIIYALRTQYDQEREFSQAMGKYFDGHFVFNPKGKIYDEIITALTDDLKIKDDLLEWWIWETDFGSNGNNWIEINDEKLVLSDASMLYDFIINYSRD